MWIDGYYKYKKVIDYAINNNLYKHIDSLTNINTINSVTLIQLRKSVFKLLINLFKLQNIKIKQNKVIYWAVLYVIELAHYTTSELYHLKCLLEMTETLKLLMTCRTKIFELLL